MSLPAYSKLDHGAQASASVDHNAALPASPLWRSAQRLKAVLITAKVFAIAGCLLAGIALALNVAAVTVKVYGPIYQHPWQQFINHRLPFTFLTTSAIWFGILNVGVCVTALLFIRKLLKGQFSDWLAVTGILVSVFSLILAGATLFTSISSSAEAARQEPYGHVWYALFTAVSVLSGLTFIANLTLSVFMAIVVSVSTGCCACQPAYTVDVAMPPPASIVYTPSQPAQLVIAPGQTMAQSV